MRGGRARDDRQAFRPKKRGAEAPPKHMTDLSPDQAPSCSSAERVQKLSYKVGSFILVE
jgi:hypothetical protein